MEKKIKFSKKTEKDMEMLVDEFGFDTEDEFVEEAVSEKILELKKQIFFNITDKIATGLNSGGMGAKEVLDEFERVRE
ncbi:MAG: hypothetical protein U9N35_06110 [Euryarchaeota archaeon]|nr:hypothetical protein [Euryarchaeota archaeon]